MELDSATRIAHSFIRKIQPACDKLMIVGDIQKALPKIKFIEISVKVLNKRLLDALLLECSTPISTSEKKLIRLYQNVKVVVHLS